ncbi:hypothetical protein QX776_05030 [Alteromonadaceae bacterium BrNp21-10]|nr:hypothetical protein [Alteromonadaceae bacterium BrNp21-10]
MSEMPIYSLYFKNRPNMSILNLVLTIKSFLLNSLPSTLAFLVITSGLVTCSSFALAEDINPSQRLAQPTIALDTLAGTTMALTIDKSLSDVVPMDQLPANALVMQTYLADGTMTFKGYGQKTIDSTGTYSYTKLGPNVALEETQQISDKLPKPINYKMLFIFETSHSGRWYQNFGDGLIYFSGTFNSFPSK